ncbi:Peroxidase [Frankliniella fusca]|uniref:Peroxidase n=1 Tax=Frankliniella fusca TaxID=407009 RepID=A0AAE1GYA4_9NEOP|nr:Peroxidase [Frankliniella fusca]
MSDRRGGHIMVVLLLVARSSSAQGALSPARPPPSAPRPEDCALQLPKQPNSIIESGPHCVTFGAVNEAFREARARAGGPRRPAAGPAPDHYVGQLGAAVEEATRLLRLRYALSRADVVLGLGAVDTRWTDLARFCPAALASRRPCQETRFRRHDGACNNLANPTWGAAGTAFRRLLPPDYADGVGAPRVALSGRPLPNPRLVSAHVHGEVSRGEDGGQHPRVTVLFVTWGQLLDHDLTLTAETKDPWTRADPPCCPPEDADPGAAQAAPAPALHPNCLGLLLPRGDPLGRCMELARSLAGLRADCTLGPRAQFNLVTAYIDAGTVYGSSYRATDALRQLRGGLLREQHLDRDPDDRDEDDDPARRETAMPPKLDYPGDGCIADPHSPEPCFLAGDNRANEQLGLTAVHVLLVREHNRLARALAALNPHWDDERLFQEVRHILAAVMQHVSFNEFLPLLLGRKAMRKHGLALLEKGTSDAYNASLDASIPDSFATAAFRFGHSLLPARLERRDADHRLLGAVPLSSALQRPFPLRRPGWLAQVVLGMAGQPASAMDAEVTAQVRDHLFQPAGRGHGKDLASINLARAREHGVPSYNHYRQLCGLTPARTWPHLAAAVGNATAELLADLFEHPDDVDLWSAGIAERVSSSSSSGSAGAMVGPTFSCLIGRTFRNLKLGDRYWYENGGQAGSFSTAQLAELRRVTLARIVCDAAVGVRTVQARPMERKHAKR